jgi:hypothetical protein
LWTANGDLLQYKNTKLVDVLEVLQEEHDLNGDSAGAVGVGLAAPMVVNPMTKSASKSKTAAGAAAAAGVGAGAGAVALEEGSSSSQPTATAGAARVSKKGSISS